MTAKTQPWFRLYSEVLSDRKIARVCTSSGQPKALIVGVWVTLLSLANDSPKRGYLLISDDMPLTSDEIIAETGLPLELGDAILKAFIASNMLRLEGDCFVIAHWDERQFVSDTSAERVRKHREQKKAKNESPPIGNEYANVKRYSNVTETPPESDTESDTESTSLEVGDKSPPVEVIKPDPPIRKAKAMTIPAVQVFVDITGKFVLNNAQIREIDERVGRDPPALDRWRETVKAWQLAGNKINGIGGMLDWFRKGIPEYARKGATNGHHGTSQNNTGYDPALESGGLTGTAREIAESWKSKRRRSRDGP